MTPVIFGLSGPALTADERAFFADARPAGYILFKHNCADRAQLRALTDSLRDLEGRDDVAILIDQEGGRVARMQPPEWPAFPDGPAFDRLYERAPSSAIEAARANAEAIGLMLAEVGVTVDCLPLLDVARPDTTDAISLRAYGHEPMRVAAMGRATLEGLAAAGVVGVVKHMPGHGRAVADSHHELPRIAASDVELQVDLEPFQRLGNAPMGMVSHLLFEAWDRERPASLSPVVINDIVRGRIGFGGLLMTDDIHMQALGGKADETAAAAIAAGCDVALACWARGGEMADIAAAVPPIRPEARRRLDAAMASVRQPDPTRFGRLIDKRDALLALA